MSKVKKVKGLSSFFWAIVTVLMLAPGFASAGLDYCWKDSYGRGVGTIPTKCSASQETQGKAPFFTCYDKCPTGYDSTALGGCMQKCPTATYRDDFGNCVDNGAKKRYKFNEYTLVSNPNPGRCNLIKYPFGHNIGNCFMDECKKRNGANGCEWHGGAVVAKCKPGYKKAALHCIPDLDCTGYVGKGVDFYGKTFCETKRKAPRPPRAADCGAGKVNDAGLCYKGCSQGYTGVGPVCWIKCPKISGKQWVDCGAGCAETDVACGLNTADMVISVLDSVVSIASLGTGSGITKLTSSARKGLTKGIKQAAKQYGKNFTKRFTSGYKKAVKTITKEGMAKVGMVQDVNTLQGTGRGIAGFFGAVQDVVGQDISQEEMDFQIAQQAIGYASLVDPSGVMGVVAAYTKPICNVIVRSRGGTPPPAPPAVAGVITPAGTAGAAAALMLNNANLTKMIEMQVKGARNDLATLKRANINKSDKVALAKNKKAIQSKQKELREKTQLIIKLKTANSKSKTRPKPTPFKVDKSANGAWVIGKNKVPGGYAIYKSSRKGWTKVPGGATQITVDNRGTPWVVNSGGSIFHRVNGKWKTIPGGAMDIGSGGGKTWVIGKNKVPGGYAIYERVGTSWKKRPGGAVRIDVDNRGNPWVVNSGGSIFHWVNGKWKTISGRAMDIGSGGGKTWVIGKGKVAGGYEIYERVGSSWKKIPGGAVRIDVGSDGIPWVVNSSGTIFKLQNRKWVAQTGKAVDIGLR